MNRTGQLIARKSPLCLFFLDTAGSLAYNHRGLLASRVGAKLFGRLVLPDAGPYCDLCASI